MEALGGSLQPEWRWEASTIISVGDAPWIRARLEGFLGQWHMPAGEGVRGWILAACDRTFSADTDLEEGEVRVIPANERCPVCQGIHAARMRNGG